MKFAAELPSDIYNQSRQELTAAPDSLTANLAPREAVSQGSEPRAASFNIAKERRHERQA